MTNRGVLGFPQGRAFASSSSSRALVNPLVMGSANNAKTVERTGSAVAATWVQMIASMPTNSVIYAASVYSTGFSGVADVGTGGAGSEVIRMSWMRRGTTQIQEEWTPMPFGVYVPAGTRVAMRFANALDGGSFAVLHYVDVSAGTQVEAGITPSGVAVNSAAWIQIDTAPPKAGGVYIVGFQWGHMGGVSRRLRLGFGSAGSEVAQTDYLQGNVFGSLGPPVFIPPLRWPPSTRLAVQADGVPTGNYDCQILWRESLA